MSFLEFIIVHILGGRFTGKVLRAIMSPECLADLRELLEGPGEIWIEYLESIREAYRACVQRKLDPEYQYEEAFNRYNEAFNVLHVATEGRLTETLKVGIALNKCHSESFRVIQSHSKSFRYIQIHSDPFRAIQSHSEPFRSIQSNLLYLKGHIFSSHVVQYFSMTGKTLAKTNDEHIERTHKDLLTHERRFNFRITKNLSGTCYFK